jgi:hypothetical protein
LGLLPESLPSRQPWLLVLAAAATAQVAVAASWAHQVGTSFAVDFQAHFGAAKLLLAGHRGSMYSAASQVAAVSASGGSHLGGLNHAGWGPVALLTVLPFTMLSVPLAAALWTVLQAGALALSAALVIARRRHPLRSADVVVLVAVVLSAPGLAALVVLGQWEGLAAVLVALFWLDTWGEHRWRATVWVLLLTGALPHLAVGLLVFQVGYWGLRQLARLAAGVAVLAGSSVALLGIDGMRGWIGQVLDLGHEVRPQDTDGLYGLVSGIFGNNVVGIAVTGFAVAVGVVVCWQLGRRLRLLTSPLSAAAALGVSALSLLFSPHVFHYGLVMLVPAAALAVINDPGRRTPVVLLLWTSLSALSLAGLHSGSVWWNPVVPAVLLALAAFAMGPPWREMSAPGSQFAAGASARSWTRQSDA